MALSATFVAAGPGAAWAVDNGATDQGWTAQAVRVEPLSGSAGLTVAGAGTYRGAIEVRRTGGRLAVVNELLLEDYVRGIEEVPPGWPAAALQAQAIAARTFAAHTAMAGEPRWQAVGADICATATCQVYRGLDAERRAQGQGWLSAVEATAGRALLAGGRPILASYSSTANGPQAMSQNGALAMAVEGRSAAEILDAYYGIRPTPATTRLPATIRVAVVMGASTVRISAAGPFRVVDAGGAELATSTSTSTSASTSMSGEWRMTAAGDGVRAVPPEAYRPATPPVASLVADIGPVTRRASRVVTAAAPPAKLGPWAPAALALVLVAGAGAATTGLSRRRRA